MLLSTMPVPIGVADELSAPTVFRIVPPVQPVVSPLVHGLPVAPAVTVSSPALPVVFSTIPLAGSAAAVPLPASMRWKVRSLAPMSVFDTSSATPETLLIVLPAPVTFSVPLVSAWRPAARAVDVEPAAGEVQRVAVARRAS